MSYSTNIPNTNQSPSLFPGQAATNWTRLKTLVNADHQFNDGAAANDGYHKVVHWGNQVGALGDNTPAPIAGVGQLYTKSVTTTGTSGATTEQLMYHQGTGGLAANEASLSVCPVRAAINFNGATLAVRWAYNCTVASAVVGANTTYTITFTSALPSVNYVAVISAGREDSVFSPMVGQHAPVAYATAHTTGAFQFTISNGQNVGIGTATVINVVIMGG